MIAVIGTGYVGLVQGACLADLGNDVICVDIDASKIARLKNGEIPIYEPGLSDIVKLNVAHNRLSFTTDADLAIKSADIIFICVGTPPKENGEADMQYVHKVAETIGKCMNTYKIIVTKSTVPVGTGDEIKKIIKKNLSKEIEFDIVSNPEFLREGASVKDFQNPDRIIIGVESERAQERIGKLYRSLERTGKPIVYTDIKSAELIKYASNAMLATRISFMNMLSQLTEKLGGDIKQVGKGLGLDNRIGPRFLQAGVGYGGSCFHPDEFIYVKSENELKCLTIKEFYEISEKKGIDECKILTADEHGICLKQVNALTIRSYKGKMIHICTNMGRKTRITDDHPIPVWENGRIKIKLSKNLAKKDILICPFGQIKGEKIQIDMFNELKKNKILLNQTWLNNKELTKNEFGILKKHLSNKYPHDIKKNGTIRLRDAIHLKEIYKYKNNRLFTVRNKATAIPSIISIDHDFARLIGYYLAEGWISIDNGRYDKIRKRIGFAFGSHETEYIKDVKTILTRLKIKNLDRISGNSHSIIVSSNILAYLFQEVLQCGSNCYEKQIPPHIFRLPKELQLEFIKGLLRGDGSITRLNKGKNLNIEYATVSRKLGHSFVVLLQICGFMASIQNKYMNKSTVPAYIVRINGINNINKLGPFFGQKWDKYKKIAKEYQRNIRPSGHKLKPNYALVPVSKIEKEDYFGDVYSVETSNSHLVVSSGLLIHNCFPKDVLELKHTLEKHGCDASIIEAVHSTNERQKKSIVPKVKKLVGNLKGKKIAIWGLAFKPRTDDMRMAPSIEIIKQLSSEGAEVHAFDPVANDNAKQIMPEIKYHNDPYSAAEDTDCIILLTEWDVFRELDFEKIRKSVRKANIVDGRNIYNPSDMEGFNYIGVGR
ncbi:nucleotide sugar dehydrogenase [Candidatus Woesearchaeota archaeon]|nr:nucleotide sugar dehydrogenase [Candidatus Woesearchaeota archaeon]